VSGGSDGREGEAALRLAGRLFELPFRMASYGLGLMAGTLEEMGKLFQTDPATPPGEPPAETRQPIRWAQPPPEPARPAAVGRTPPAPLRAAETVTERKENPMAYEGRDTDLSGDDLKVVEYSIVTVQSNMDDDKRVVQKMKTIAVSDDMRPEDFATWVVAKFIQSKKGKDYPHEKKKYLRVCYRVLCRMAFEKDDEVDVLRDIQKTLKEGFDGKRGSGGAAIPKQATESATSSGSSGSSGGSGGGSTPADKAKKK
jgi:hypothetical protein